MCIRDRSNPGGGPNDEARLGAGEYWSEDKGYAKNWAEDPDIGRGYDDPGVASTDISSLRMVNLDTARCV